MLVDAIRHGTASARPLASTIAVAAGLAVALRRRPMLWVVVAGSVAYAAAITVELLAQG